MRYGNHSLIQRMARSPITLIALIILFGLMSHAAWNVYSHERLASAELARSQADFDDLQEQKEALTQKIAHLSTEDGVEAELREKYRAVREGESVAVIIDATSSSFSHATSTPQTGWWSRVLRALGF